MTGWSAGSILVTERTFERNLGLLYAKTFYDAARAARETAGNPAACRPSICLLYTSFGEKLDVLQRFQDQVKVSTSTGITGWIEERELLSADVWQTAKDLTKKAATMPVEARGHTKTLSNLHIEPGRDSLRIRQLYKNTALDVLARQPVSAAAVRGAGAEEDPKAESAGKKEDWWLVLAHNSDQTTMAGLSLIHI